MSNDKQIMNGITPNYPDFHLYEKNIEMLAGLYENTNRFINNHLDNTVKEEMASIEERGYSEEAKEWFYEDLEWYKEITINSIDILSHYIIVGLYSLYERTLKKFLIRTGSFSDNEIKNVFKAKNLSTKLKEKFDIDYDSLSSEDFKDLTELRFLNNTIKHSDVIQEKLHEANNKWKVGEKLPNLIDDFQRLRNAPLRYLNLLDDVLPRVS